MTAIDTNIIVRFLTGDDQKQFAKVKQVFSQQNLFIPDTVLLESEWVLRFAYHFTPLEINNAFTSLLGLPNVTTDTPLQLIQTLEMHKDGFDFADALHLAKSQPHSSIFLTFDKKFINIAKRKSDCKVKEP
jgi:predicted nucleic-acid-binding protein